MKSFSFSRLAGIALGLSMTTNTQAQSTMTVDTTALKPASVTGSFSDVTPDIAPRALAVLEAQEIGKSGATSVADVLEAVPGIDVRSRGPFGIQTDLSVRGGTFEQTALWVDGVRWSAPQTGHHLMDLPMDPEDISRIEVFRGGSSSALGSGAMTGAVALTAGPATRNGTKIVAETGSHAWMRAMVTHDFGSALDLNKSAVKRHRISLSRMGTNGTLGANTNTDAEVIRARYSGWFAGDWGSLRASAGYARKAFGAQNFYTDPSYTEFERTQTFQAQALYTRKFDLSTLEAALYQRSHTDFYELWRNHPDYYQFNEDSTVFASAADTVPSWYIGFGPNQTITHLTGARVRWEQSSSLGQTFVSMDSRREFVKSNRLGVDSLGDEEGVYALGDVRLNTDLALGHRASFGRLTFSATAALNHNTMFGTQFVPSADVVIDLSKDGSNIAFVSGNRSVRSPSFTELYYPVPGTLGDRDLLVETNEMLEAGVRLSLNQNGPYAFRLEQSIYHRQGQNLIDFIRPYENNEDDTVYAVNLDGVSFTGLETVCTISPRRTSEESDFQLRYARLGFTTMEANKRSEGFESFYVLDGLATKADCSMGLGVPGDIDIDLRLSYQDRLGGYKDFETDKEVEFSPFMLASMTASRTFFEGQFRTYLRVDNLTDIDYLDRGGVQQPGRWIRLGFGYNMK